MTRPATTETTQGSTPQFPPMTGRLRPATGEDVRLHLIDLERHHGGDQPWTTRQFSAYCLRRRTGHGLLVFATDGGAVAGYLAYVMTGEVIAVTRLLVRPCDRRRGVGRQLMERVAMITGHRILYTVLPDRLTDPLLFLRSVGIDTIGQRGPLDMDKELVIRMVKKKVK